MLDWLAAQAIGFALSYVADWLQKKGYPEAAAELGEKAGHEILTDLKNLQTTNEFPAGKNGQTQTDQISLPLNVSDTSYTPHD